MEKNMLNFRKNLSAGGSRISMIATIMAGLLGLGRGASMVPDIVFHAPPEPLPRSKHGCCKRGGRQKRRLGLNYWRR